MRFWCRKGWRGSRNGSPTFLVSEGLARVEKRVTNLPLAEAMETARHARAGMWEYGDVDSDDDEPEGGGAKPGAWGRRR